MEKGDNYLGPGHGKNLEFSGDEDDSHRDQHEHYHHHRQLMNMGETSGHLGGIGSGGIIVDHVLNDHDHNPSSSSCNYVLASSGLCSAASVDRFSFADVLQFADFGPKLSLDHNYTSNIIGFDCDENTSTATATDPVYFLKFPVLGDSQLEQQEEEQQQYHEQEHPLPTGAAQHFEAGDARALHSTGERDGGQVGIVMPGASDAVQVQLECVAGNDNGNNIDQKRAPSSAATEVKSKRKRPKANRSSEEVESQRMIHIAVERNRRKQMNEHLRVLRSLMPTSYVQRGDQASIIGGAIEFVRELEQLLQCLESQKRRRLYGEGLIGSGTAAGAPASEHGNILDNNNTLHQSQPPFLPSFSSDTTSSMELDGTSSSTTAGLGEDVAESKSCIADVEVKLLGFDALIKILSRRRPGQLIKAIAALEDMQFTVLRTNVTTIEQTVLYSFNVKVSSDQSRFTAGEIASSVQQIFTFIHANTGSL